MDNSESRRRSGRKRTVNKRYSVDAFEGLDILGSDSEAGPGGQAQDDSEEDEEFTIEKTTNGVDGLEEEESSVAEGSEASDGSAVATAAEDDGDAMSIDSGRELTDVIQGGMISTPPKVGPYQTKAARKSQGVHIRGLPDAHRHAAKFENLTCIFGTGTEELVTLARSRDKWVNDATLPTRGVDKHGAGGLGHSLSHTEEKRKMEATAGWDWYHDHGGKDRLGKRQKMRHLSPDEGHVYLPRPAKDSQSFLLGPYGKQTMHSLEPRMAMDFGDAWRSMAESSSEEGGGTSRKGRREGWILNAGGKIQCMDWAPNQNGNMQLLALSTPGTPSKAQHDQPQKPGEPPKAPAFTPSPPTPACIQIWAFAALTEIEREGLMDLSRIPKLQMVLCTEWGDIKQLKWCPTPRDLREGDGEANYSLGLLAGIWGDGRVKVLDLRINKDWDSPTAYSEHSFPSQRRQTLTASYPQSRSIPQHLMPVPQTHYAHA